jgi:hypothetical protein
VGEKERDIERVGRGGGSKRGRAGGGCSRDST